MDNVIVSIRFFGDTEITTIEFLSKQDNLSKIEDEILERIRADEYYDPMNINTISFTISPRYVTLHKKKKS